MIKVRSGCVRRQSDAKEVTAKPSAWPFVNTVFERFDSDRIYNRLMSHWKIYKRTRRTGWRKTSWQNSQAVNYAKLCREDCDRFFESTYENKTGMIKNNDMVICRKDRYCHSRF